MMKRQDKKKKRASTKVRTFDQCVHLPTMPAGGAHKEQRRIRTDAVEGLLPLPARPNNDSVSEAHQ